jgi:penicillin-binding protein 2
MALMAGGDGKGLRMGVLGVVALSLFATLFARLWYLTAAAPDEGFEENIQATSTRQVQIPPMRGRILDRNGYELAANRPVLTVTVDREVIRDDEERAILLTRLAGPLATTPEALEERFTSDQYSPFLPVPLAENVPETTAIFLKERREDYPGVDVVEGWQRVYRYAPLASHVVGYLGAIPEEGADDFLAQGYLLSDRVGKAGVEQQYETTLRGTPGSVVYEVDVRGRIVRELSRVEPTPGKDVVLALDLPLQQYAERVLEQGLEEARTRHPAVGRDEVYVGPNFKAPAGSVVAMDPRNGQILAMASYPTFDNRWFVEGITNDKINELYPDADVSAPFVNRAISGRYQMGSTFKLVTSVAGLTFNDITPNRVFDDQGSYLIPDCDAEQFKCEYTNAGGATTRYGEINLPRALTVSADTYFYSVGVNLHNRGRFEGAARGLDEQVYFLQDIAKQFGYGSDSGIDLPYEYDGLVPDAAAKKMLAEAGAISDDEGRGWYVGDNLQLAIGQGLLTATPLQLTNSYATFANGGTRFRPMVALGTIQPGAPTVTSGRVDMGQVVWDLKVDAEIRDQVALQGDWWMAIHQGFVGAVNDYRGFQGGTAASTFLNYPFKSTMPVAGKTGTAQSGSKDALEDDSLFVAYGPTNAGTTPSFTVGAVIQDAGYGSWGAAPIVKCMFEGLADRARLDPVEQSEPLDKTATRPQSLPNLDPADAACLELNDSRAAD